MNIETNMKKVTTKTEEVITLDYGDGTKKSYDLIKNVFVKRFSNPILEKLSDAARIKEIVFSCDSFTVNPIYFPGSNIGKLSVCGTVNDICVSAAIPQYLTLAIIVEEGFPKEELEKIADSIQEEKNNAGIEIVGGDFKVVEKGKIDKIFIITSGIGKRIKGTNPSVKKIGHKDKIIVTGGVGEHGISVMLSRNNIFEFNITSDCQSLRNTLVPLWENFPEIKFMRDPTRGGIATTLNEISTESGIGAIINEDRIPLRKDVKAACELLGIDPYYLACEGRAVIVTAKEEASAVLRLLKQNGSKQAQIIGEFNRNIDKVVLNTISGGKRIIDFSYAFNLPRIC